MMLLRIVSAAPHLATRIRAAGARRCGLLIALVAAEFAAGQPAWRRGPRRLPLLQHGQDVPGWILEPGDQRPAATDDALLVRSGAWGPLHLDAAGGELGDRSFDVGYREVQDREGGRDMVVIGVGDHLRPAAQADAEQAVVLSDVQAQDPGVERPGRRGVADREPAESLAAAEHDRLLL